MTLLDFAWVFLILRRVMFVKHRLWLAFFVIYRMCFLGNKSLKIKTPKSYLIPYHLKYIYTETL